MPASSAVSGKSGSYALSFGEIIGYCWLFGTFAKCDFLAGVYMEIAGGTVAGDGCPGLISCRRISPRQMMSEYDSF